MLAKYKNIKSFKIRGKSGQVKIDLGKSIFQLLAQLGEQGSILSVHTEKICKRDLKQKCLLINQCTFLHLTYD